MESFESLWTYCTENKRLCPSPKNWNDLYAMLKDTKQKPSGGWEPPLPLILAAWYETIPLAKQLRFREHVQWASDQQQLDEIGTYLRSLSEDKWFHYGEL